MYDDPPADVPSEPVSRSRRSSRPRLDRIHALAARPWATTPRPTACVRSCVRSPRTARSARRSRTPIRPTAASPSHEPCPSRFDSRSSSACRARTSIARATCAGRSGSRRRPSSGWPPTRTVTPATAAALALFGLAFVAVDRVRRRHRRTGADRGGRDVEPRRCGPRRDRDGRAEPRADGRPDRSPTPAPTAVAQPDPIAEPEPQPTRHRPRARRPSRRRSRRRSRRPPALRC